MPPHALLEAAGGLLRRVLRCDQPADRLVAQFFRSHHQLGPRERQLLADTVYAVLRSRLLFEHLARDGPGSRERRLAVLGWAGSPGRLQAALDDETRAWLDRAAATDRAALPDDLRHNLPAWIAASLRAGLGESGFWSFIDAVSHPAPLDLRVNLLKADREGVRRALAESGIAASPTPYSPLGLRVQGKPALQRSAPFGRGEVEVQDEGSQLLALLVGARRGEMVVDFCAGGGGKTLALGAAMRNTGRLYAFDTSGHRLAELRPRIARAGLDIVHTAQIAHERDGRVLRLVGKVDRVLVDAPCSGLGTLRRNPDLKWRQSPQAVEELVGRQRAILGAAARLVKSGGRLVYATCSVLEVENEGVASVFERDAGVPFERVAAADALARAGVASPAELVVGERLQLWPHRHGTDGFFAAAWRRR